MIDAGESRDYLGPAERRVGVGREDVESADGGAPAQAVTVRVGPARRDGGVESPAVSGRLNLHRGKALAATTVARVKGEDAAPDRRRRAPHRAHRFRAKERPAAERSTTGSAAARRPRIAAAAARAMRASVTARCVVSCPASPRET